MPIRDRPLPSIVPALFPEKQPDATRSHGMPARLAALTKQIAVRMLQESRSGEDLATSCGPHPASTGKRKIHRHQDRAKELIHRASPG